MKLNWGHGITFVFICFAVMMGYLVFRCQRSGVQLVSRDYYSDELEYQQHIDGARHANALSAPVSIRETEGRVSLRFPAEMKGKKTEGDIWFYCAANDKKDLRMVLQPDEALTQSVDRRLLPAGNYLVKLKWTTEGRIYYTEQNLSLQ